MVPQKRGKQYQYMKEKFRKINSIARPSFISLFVVEELAYIKITA